MLMLNADANDSRRLFHIAGPETEIAFAESIVQVRDIK
jgi:hypothetical protein